MNWRNTSRGTAESDCGRYQIHTSRSERGDFHNAWYVPTNKHVSADHDKALVKAACEAHAASLQAEP
jgi:hypothetical protein